MRNEAQLHRWLAGAGTLTALAAMILLMGSLAAPASGSAASAAGRPQAPSLSAQTMTATLFLPIVSHPESVQPNMWQGEYYTNANLSGDPAYTTEETRVDYDWGNGRAADGMPPDHFSVRWTGDWDFEAGEYTFFAYADDGVRLWLDGDLLIDYWMPGMGSHEAKRVIETAGRHLLKLEYFENTGEAAIRLRWRRTDLYPQWHADLYNEPWVEGGWVYDRTDSVIQFDWGHGCPSYLPCDSFSVAWNAAPLFESGTHRIHLYADEGYQLFVDGNKVKEGGWYDGQTGGSEDVTFDLEAAGIEHHQVAYNFHDRGTLAEARLWIENMEHPDWTAEYYGNKDLSGTPVVTRTEDAIFHDWKLGKPRNKLPSDHFSIRWSGERYFHAGCYRFGLFADDGVRLWVDDELLVDEWHDGRAEYHSLVTYLATGYHQVAVEYYENAGEAEIRLWWE
ncbi:MAG: PA14 domain-containing protein [Anaerolineae bacterium]|jgi:hypothetical protein